MSSGVALAQLNRFVESDSVISIFGYRIALKGNHSVVSAGSSYGPVCVVLGILVLLAGTFRFYYVQSYLMQKKFPVANLSATFLALAATVCIVLFLVLASKI